MTTSDNRSGVPQRAGDRAASAKQDREARLKAALKANIARRKEQARNRAADAPAPPSKD
jgi:hypothetical protein